MRPRRTSEFLDETAAPNAASARSTRTTTHRLQTTPGTAQKFLQRATLGTRNSFDRGPVSVLSASRAGTSVSRGATPLRQSSTRCALFATGTNGVGALHNDKRWVQEQTQKITEHLKRAVLLGHASVDFINQTSLRQMSIKQFVATFNYFLQFIAGSRLSVGSNHVEDIVSVLQKLQYPYAVNKSWLKTPNTQHSFGNVIVLFSYMLDFVPPSGSEELDECLFELEASPGQLTERSLLSWDPDFQQQMMEHCAEAFSLWDKQLMNDYAKMQQETCNLFIKKRSDLPNSAALEQAIDTVGHDIEELRENCKPLANEQVQEQQQLSDELNKLNESKTNSIGKLNALQQEYEEATEEFNFYNNKIMVLQQEVRKLKEHKKQQICSVQERDMLVSQFVELKRKFESERRTMQTLQKQNDHKQIQVSRSKLQLNDKNEQFNARICKIIEIVQDCKWLKGNKHLTAIVNGQLNLPFNVESAQLENVQEMLHVFNKQISKEMQNMQLKCNDLSKQVENNEFQIKLKLQTEVDFQKKKLSMLRNAFQQEQDQKSQELKEMTECYQQLQLEISQHELKLRHISEECGRKQEKLKNLKEKLETKLKETEVKHGKCMSELDKFYGKYEAQLQENMKDLSDLHQWLLQLEQ